MKTKPKQRNKIFVKVKPSNIALNNSKSNTINLPPKISEKFKITINKNMKLNSNSKNNQKNKDNKTIDIRYNKIIKSEKKVKERCGSARSMLNRNNYGYNKDIYEKILAFKRKEKNKIRTNSALSKKTNNLNNKDINKSKNIIKILYLNEKDLFDLDKNIKNNIYHFLNVLYIHVEIEYEIIDIIEKSKNFNDKKKLYIRLFELFNNFFDAFDSFNEINFFMKVELNKLLQKGLELLLCYHSILFINIILLSVNDSISIINTQYNTQFKKISKMIYNIFYKFIYIDLKNKNLLQKISFNFDNFIENKLNELFEKNKYKLNINTKNKNSEEIISNFNKNIETNFIELKEVAETMRLSPIAPAANSVKLLINSINKKNLFSFIDIINNVILYSLKNKNIVKAYQNAENDKNNGNEYSRNSVPYLPKIGNNKEYTLVLDLDETLIHYFSSKVEVKGDPNYGYFSSDDEYGIFNNYLNKNENWKKNASKNNDLLKIGMFLLRPYAKQFLHELNKYYEIVIFTTGTKEYCDRVLHLLDLDNNLIKYRLYKHHISLRNINVSVKDLSLLGRDLNKTIIVDNLEENYKLQSDNGLPSITWKGDINDFSLKYLTSILKNIAINKVADVRKIIKKIKSQIKSEKNPTYSKVNINFIFS